MELLEREGPLRALAAAPPGGVVLVAGEAGIGKTSLVRRFCDGQARPAMWGACDSMRTPGPLGAVRDIARQAGGALAAALDAGGPRHEVFAAFLEVTGGAGAVTVVEDAHWADEATLDVLGYAARRIWGTPGLLIVTYRDDEVGPGHPLRLLLGALATSRGVLRLRVGPLSPAGVAALARQAGPGAGAGPDPAALHELTGGNPFFVTEVLADPGQKIPSSVRDAALARAAGLGPGPRAALEAASVFPGGAPLTLIDAAPGDVDGCVAAGMLVAEGPRVRFRHELARLAVEESVLPGRRAQLHAAALARLTAAGADPARLAYHAEEAGDGPAVLAAAPLAARRALAAGASRQAAEQYARALRFAGPLPPADLAALYEAHAEASDAFAEAAALSSSAAALERWREAGDAGREAALLARRAHYLWAAGEGAAARASVREAVTLAERQPPGPALAAACTWSAHLLMLARDLPEAVKAGERAVELAGRYGPPAVLGRALGALGTSLFLADPARSDELLSRAADVARDAGDDTGVALALVNLGSAAGEGRRYAVAESALRAAIDWCAARDLERLRGYAAAWLARCRFEAGAWAEATRLLGEAGTGDPGAATATAMTSIVRLTVLGRLRARRGDPGAAGALERAWELAEQTGDLQRLWPAAAGRAELAWLSGRPDDEVAALAAPTYELAVRLGHPWAIGELGQWLAPQRAGEWPEPGPAGPYRLPPAEAAAAWEQAGCPYEAAAALAADGATDSVAQALRRFERLGARPAADRAAAALRAAGVRPARRSTLSHPAGLSEREAQVLALLRENLTNAEIAGRLSISVKTVDHHVSAVLAKLGVRSRREAARLDAAGPGGTAG